MILVLKVCSSNASSDEDDCFVGHGHTKLELSILQGFLGSVMVFWKLHEKKLRGVRRHFIDSELLIRSARLYFFFDGVGSWIGGGFVVALMNLFVFLVFWKCFERKGFAFFVLVLAKTVVLLCSGVIFILSSSVLGLVRKMLCWFDLSSEGLGA